MYIAHIYIFENITELLENIAHIFGLVEQT